MRRRRRDESPDRADAKESIAHYKLHPAQFLPPSSPPSLYTATCDKCCSQGNSYIVDTTSSILGEVDITSKTCESLCQRLVMMSVASVYSKGVLVSPGQLEVLRTVVKSGAVVVMSLTSHQGPVSDAVLQTLSLLTHGVRPSLISVRDMQTWSSWALSVLGLEVTQDNQGDFAKIIKKGGIVMTENVTDTVRTLIDKSTDRNLLVVPSSVSHDLCHGSRRGHRARLEVGRPMSVREMTRGQDCGLATIVAHCDIIERRQTRVTPSQLLTFAVQSGFQNLKQQELTVEDLSKAVSGLIPMLEARGARMSFSGEAEDVVNWAVIRMGGHISSDKVNLELDDEAILRAESLLTYFLFDYAVSVGVYSSLRESILTSRPGMKSRGQSVTVGHQEVVDTALTVVQFLGEDRASLLPCEDLTQGVMEAMFRAETSGSLVTETEERGSQYESEMSERQKYGWRHGREAEEDWNVDEDGVSKDTRMVVGHSQEGRNWLNWTARIMRHRLRNLYITLLILYNNADTDIFVLTELEAMVTEEVERRKRKGWKESCLFQTSSATRKSITSLELLGFIKIIPKKEICLVKVIGFPEIAEMLQVILELG